MRSIWPNMEFIGTYGTLMFILSWCLNYNAWYDTDQGRELFNTILDIDAAMIDAGRLPHYFAYLVAKKNDRKPAELSRASQADRQARAVQGGRLSTEPGE